MQEAVSEWLLKPALFRLILVVMLLCLNGCGGSFEKVRSESPDGSCQLTISDYYKSIVPLDPNADIELHCQGFRKTTFRGRYDWYYRNSAVSWDMAAKRVKVFACGKVGPPIVAEFDLAPPSLRFVNEKGIKLIDAKKGPARLPPPVDDGSDKLLRATCYVDHP